MPFNTPTHVCLSVCRYKLWEYAFVRVAPDIEKLFQSVAHTCLGPQGLPGAAQVGAGGPGGAAAGGAGGATLPPGPHPQQPSQPPHGAQAPPQQQAHFLAQALQYGGIAAQQLQQLQQQAQQQAQQQYQAMSQFSSQQPGQFGGHPGHPVSR